MHVKISSAISFNLDHSKILSSGNGLSPTLPEQGSFIVFILYNIGETGSCRHFKGGYLDFSHFTKLKNK